MKYLLLLLLVLTGCALTRTPVKYNDLVIVTDGFYKGCKGVAKSKDDTGRIIIDFSLGNCTGAGISSVRPGLVVIIGADLDDPD